VTQANPTDYREAFAARSGGLAAARAQGLEAFEASGFPTRALEAWRYTNPAPITQVGWKLSDDAPAALPDRFVENLPDLGGSRAVFLNGEFHEAASRIATSGPVGFSALGASDPASVPRYGALAESKQKGFTAFNTALSTDGAAIHIRAGDDPAEPVHIVFATTERENHTATFPRVWIHAESQARGQVLIDHLSLGGRATQKRFTCSVAEIFVGEGASLDVTVVQREDDATFHVAHHAAELERDSRLRFQTLALGGAIVRNDLETLLSAPGAECELDGLFLGRGDQRVDNHTLVDHATPRCESRERYKGIVADAARGVFRGRVLVRPDAQHTNATQHNSNLILTAGAEIDTKPQLEIYADDVSCSHGSSIGKLDEEALFFLRARGLAPDFARRLLMSGFANEITQTIRHEGLRAWLDGVVAERLDALMGGDEAP